MAYALGAIAELQVSFWIINSTSQIANLSHIDVKCGEMVEGDNTQCIINWWRR